MKIIEAYKQNKNLSAAEIHSIFQAPNYYSYRRNVSIRPFIWMLAELDGAAEHWSAILHPPLTSDRKMENKYNNSPEISYSQETCKNMFTIKFCLTFSAGIW